jgi:hypothetical protein
MITDIGRLAFRHEGEFWNAYWAPNLNNMDGILLIGSIRMATVNGMVREDFMTLMTNAFDVIVKDSLGKTPTWNKPKPAPENERGGNA